MRAFGIACALALCSAACAFRVVDDGRVNAHVAKRIERDIATLRGLRFVEPVPIDIKRPDELRAYLIELLDRDFSPQDIRDLSRVYATLGLLPPDFDLREALLNLYTAQVAGFYDPRSDRLYLVDPPVSGVGPLVTTLELILRRDLVGEMLLAHELTHALQDQTSDAIALTEDKENDDRSLAARAVVEGDATIAGFAYTLGGLDEATLVTLVDRLSVIPDQLAAVLPDTPPVLRDSLVFQYSQGARFVSWAYLRGGWRAVDALLRHPPASTEQVLWPERYFTNPDAPTRIELGGLEDYGEGWRRLEENTLGELVVGIQLRGFVDRERAAWASRGWDGDRYAAFASGESLHLYWMSVWDSERDAREFFDAEREALSLRKGSRLAASSGERATSDGALPWLVERRGLRVLIAIGAPPDEVEERRERLWAESRFSVERQQLDLDLGFHPRGRVVSDADASQTPGRAKPGG